MSQQNAPGDVANGQDGGIAGPPRPNPQPEPITFDRVPGAGHEGRVVAAFAVVALACFAAIRPARKI